MSPTAQPRISLVIVNYESGPLTERLIRAVGDGADEIVVVDNASKQAGLETVRTIDDVTVIDLPVNVGYGAGANAGAERCSGDVIVIANPDVLIGSAGLRALAGRAFKAGIAGPRFHYPDGALQRSAHRREPLLLTTLHETCPPVGGLMARIAPDWHPTLRSSRDHEHDQHAVHLLGALLAVDAQLFAQLGGFDERYFLYREETDLCRRAAHRGFEVLYVADVEAEHASGASTSDPWPLATRPVWLASHYRYIATHRGKAVAYLARALGTMGSAVAMLQPARSRAAWRSLRWHLGAPAGR